MIGWICISAFKYYDSKNHKMSFKGRPVLVIGQADASDYVALPISRVTKRENLDIHYDYEMNPATYVGSALHLSEISFVRTHKQSILHEAEFTKQVLDLKGEYPTVYKEIINLVEEFQKELISKAAI